MSRQKISRRHLDAQLLSSLQQGDVMRLRNASAGAAHVLRALPVADAHTVHTDNFGHFADAAELSDDR